MKNTYLLLLSLFVFNVVNAQIVNIPDPNLKAVLCGATTTNAIAYGINNTWIEIDTNNNNEIEVSEALQVYKLSMSDFNISSLTGISSFTNLTHLNCRYNQLSSFNSSDFIGLTNFTSLDIEGNQLTSLNVSGLTNLEYLRCQNNQIASLSLNNLTGLQYLLCDGNQLTSLNLNSIPSLIYVRCHTNQLTSIDLSALTNLQTLECESNQLTSLNLNTHTNLQNLRCQSNQLTSLFIKNGKNETDLNFSANPNLTYICADESQLNSIQNSLNTLGYTNTVLNSYCSFTPGGNFYTVNGSSKVDSNNNGCEVSDSGWSNFKLNIVSGSTTGSLISDAFGNYSIPIQTGTLTISPVIENPSYFTVSPTSVSVSFPTQTSPFLQNFCITPNGIHPDLEVTLLPVEVARPGFDALYTIFYKNKGTTTQSGAVSLTFNDTVLDLVTSNPVVSSAITNSLSWDFTNLQPAESRLITLTLNVNTPTETPAVNGGDFLNYSTTITSSAIDETPLDNTFALNQIVVNSFDPNDKTCLEGATITPDMVGKYVHYMIRFENTGTFSAENVVVKDMIDTSRFEVSTLVPISGSHSFFTRITAGNKVEFIFENIDLPFDDANNDGYVAFKIKTKPTLVVGNTFSNTASIYFDYNAPIVTDPAITTIALLGTPDFEFSTYFSLYPNPASTLLNIDFKKDIEVSSVNIYNALGQLVLVIPNAQQFEAIDISGLTKGNYFMKINTDKGTSTAKFVKI